MTKYKQELRKHGFRLECDYPFLPYDVNGIALEGVSAKIENNKIVVTNFSVVGIAKSIIDKNFNVIETDFE